MTTKSIILMTALPPTTGHLDLVTWGAHLPANEVFVLLSARSFEPLAGNLRKAALEDSLSILHNVTVRLHEDDKAPQNPEDHSNFWQWWKTTINNHFPEVRGEWDYVIASEAYGQQVADTLGAAFMPYDVQRQLNPTKATATRLQPLQKWQELLPLVRRQYQKRLVFFGQESVGKTTLSRNLHERLPSTLLPEWARPYLETVGPTLNSEVMKRIYKGQSSLQEIAFKKATQPFTLLDTDLYSTIGYHHIGAYTLPLALEEAASQWAGDLYLLLPDDVPFEEDVLRYGGHERESTYNFWKKLLEDYNLPYVEVPPGGLEEKVTFIEREARKLFSTSWQPLEAFLRD